MERMWEAPTEAIAATKHYQRAAPKPAPTPATTDAAADPAAKDAKDEEAAAATRIQAMHRGRKSRQSLPAAATSAKAVVEGDLIVEEVDKVVAGVMEGVSSEVLSVLPFSEPWEVFRQLDVDGDGSLEYDQLFEFVAGMDENVANELMSMLDTNQDGKIDFQEFKAGWGSLFGADRPPSSMADVREVVMERSGKLADLSLAEEEAAATRIQAIHRGRKTRAARPPSLEPVSLHKHTSRNTSVYRKISEAIKDGADEEFAHSLEDVHDAFAGVDGEQSGEVDATQFEKAMARLDLGLGAAQLREIFALTDNDGSGKIVYAEFAAELCSESTPGVRRKKTVTESPWGASEPNPFLASGPLNASQKLGSTLPRNAHSLDGAGSDGGAPSEAETRAATTLQAVQRGRLARSPRKVAARKVAREERRAAVRIQATVRGRKSRQVTERQHGGGAAKPAATRTRAGPRAGHGANDKEKQSPRSKVKVEATAEQIAEQDAAAFERIAHSKTAKQSPMAQMLAKQIREGQRKAEETAARGGKRGGRGGRGGRGRGRASAGRGARGNDGLNRREAKPFGDVTSRPEQRLAAKRRRRPQEKQDVVEQVVGELVSAALGDAVRTVVQDTRQRRDEARAIKAVLLGRDNSFGQSTHGDRRQRGRRASKKGVVAAVGRPLYRVAEREAAEQSASATSLASLAAASQDRSSIGSRGRFIEENARQRRRDASQAHTSGPRRVAIRAVGGGGGAGPRVLPKHLPALPAGAPAVHGAA